MLIDSHCHLQDAAFTTDLPEVLARARTEGVEKSIVIGTNYADSQKAVELTTKHEGIYAAVGLYPHELEEENLRDKLIDLAHSTRVVAVGECGLDYSKDSQNTKAKQKELFRKQIGTAIQLDLPLVIHNRDANEDILTELGHYKATGLLKGVFHCFTQDSAFAHKVLNLGFYISFTGIITYKSAKNLEQVVKEVPLERILIETDAPYLSPDVAGQARAKRNEPKNVKLVAEKIAELRGTTLESIEAATTKNAHALFKLA